MPAPSAIIPATPTSASQRPRGACWSFEAKSASASSSCTAGASHDGAAGTSLSPESSAANRVATGAVAFSIVNTSRAGAAAGPEASAGTSPTASSPGSANASSSSASTRAAERCRLSRASFHATTLIAVAMASDTRLTQSTSTPSLGPPVPNSAFLWKKAPSLPQLEFHGDLDDDVYGWPWRRAGPKRHWRTASMAFCSRPAPRLRVTRTLPTEPSCFTTISSSTSPSMNRRRASSV